MKKLIFLLATLFLAIGCSKNEEERIIESFLEYIHLNFDEPQSVEEILLLSNPETVSFDSAYNMGRRIVEEIDSTEAQILELDSLFHQSITEITNNRTIINYIRKHQDTDPVVQNFEKLLLELHNELKASILNSLESILNTKNADKLKAFLADTTLHFSKFEKRVIRYRELIQGEKRIDSIFYLIKDNGTPYFSKKDVSVNDFNEKSEDITIAIAGALGELKDLEKQLKIFMEIDIATRMIKSKALNDEVTEIEENEGYENDWQDAMSLVFEEIEESSASLTYIYSGIIDKQFPITVEWEFSNGVLENGSYYYDKRPNSIFRLSCDFKCDEKGIISIYEYTGSGKNSGIFKINKDDFLKDSFEGVFVLTSNGKEMPFKMYNKRVK